MHCNALLSLLALSTAVNAAPAPQWGFGGGNGAGSQASIANLKDKIKHFVVLVMENRSLDNLLGGQTTPGLSNPVQGGPFCNPYNLSNPLQGFVCTQARDFDEVVDDPNHSVTGNNLEFYGTYTPNNDLISSGLLQPLMQGFPTEEITLYDSTQNSTYLAQQVMNYYTEEQVAVLTALTKNFVTFNHWHSAIPGPTNPNRVALHSGTSAGHGTNNFPYGSMQQMSIFQKLTETNHSWKNYVTDTSEEDALWFNWTYTSGNTKYVVPLADFQSDCAAGTLPEYSVIGPSCCGVGTTSMHPQGLVSDGEQLIKDTYEYLRASPNWNESLLLITFDETGGFHDHIQPPLATRPDDLTYTETAHNGKNYTFSFDRLGGRMPTWLISPWVQQGHVEQQGTNSAGEIVSYSAGSMLRTLGYLWDFDPFTPRVQDSASFDALVTQSLRTDTPETLPEVYAW